MDECEVTFGFLIEKTFARMCREFLAGVAYGRLDLLDTARYSAPRRGVPPEQMPSQYRGICRDPIFAWTESFRGSGVVEPAGHELEACLLLEELTITGRARDGFILALEDAREVLARTGPPVEREIIWVRRIDAGDPPLAEAMLLGYEPSEFYGPEYNSAVAEGMFFSCWRREREEDPQLKTHHAKLNKWGLFDTPVDAEQYLQTYLSSLPKDWDEQFCTYYTTEVRCINGHSGQSPIK